MAIVAFCVPNPALASFLVTLAVAAVAQVEPSYSSVLLVFPEGILAPKNDNQAFCVPVAP